MRNIWDYLPAHLKRHHNPRPCYQSPVRLRGLRAASSLHDWLEADMAGYSEPPAPPEEQDTAKMRRTAHITREIWPITYHTRPLWIVDAVTERREATP